MKLFKMMSLLLVLSLISANTTYAQSQASTLTEEQKEMIKENIEAYMADLNLSEEQQPQFEEITRKYAEQMIAVKEDGGSRMSKYRKVKSIRKNKNKEMKELLSDKQYDIYLDQQKEQQARMKERQKNSNG